MVQDINRKIDTVAKKEIDVEKRLDTVDKRLGGLIRQVHRVSSISENNWWTTWDYIDHITYFSLYTDEIEMQH